MGPESASSPTVGVVGSGAMGAGIAQVALTAGLHVVLHDSNPAALCKAREQIVAGVERLVQKGRVSADMVQRIDDHLVLGGEGELHEGSWVLDAFRFGVAAGA